MNEKSYCKSESIGSEFVLSAAIRPTPIERCWMPIDVRLAQRMKLLLTLSVSVSNSIQQDDVQVDKLSDPDVLRTARKLRRFRKGIVKCLAAISNLSDSIEQSE